MSLHAVPVLGAFHVTLTDIYLEGLDVEEAKTGLVLGPDGAFILLVEDLQVPHLHHPYRHSTMRSNSRERAARGTWAPQRHSHLRWLCDGCSRSCVW